MNLGEGEGDGGTGPGLGSVLHSSNILGAWLTKKRLRNASSFKGGQKYGPGLNSNDIIRATGEIWIRAAWKKIVLQQCSISWIGSLGCGMQENTLVFKGEKKMERAQKGDRCRRATRGDSGEGWWQEVLSRDWRAGWAFFSQKKKRINLEFLNHSSPSPGKLGVSS